MSENLIQIPKFHNNDYSAMEALKGLSDVSDDIEMFGFVDIANDVKKFSKTDLTAVGLFCGCGGISKGLEMAGINVIAGLDFLKEAGETYKTNFDHKFAMAILQKVR